MTSIWHTAALPTSARERAPLSTSARECAALPDKVDVAVIGGGITGLSTALRLSDAGATVAVLEAGRVGESNTGNSTGNLYATLSSGLAGLRQRWNDDVVREVVAARADAVRFIGDTATRFGIDCDLQPAAVHFCADSPAAELRRRLASEQEATAVAGLPAVLQTRLEGWPLPLTTLLSIDGQLQFNPLHYAQGLAQALRVRGVAVHEQCRVLDIDARAGRIETSAGALMAEQLVHATHTPLGINVVQAEMEAYREAGVALPWQGPPLPPGIVWLQGASLSLRSYREGGRTWLVVVGIKEKVGQPRVTNPHRQLIAEARTLFGDHLAPEREESDGGRQWWWSAQQYKPADGLPYIGRTTHENVHIATGFAADGLVWGTYAAKAIAAAIAGTLTDVAAGESADAGDLAKRLSPWRFTPVKSARVWLAENATVAAELAKRLLPAGDASDLEAIRPGEGRIVQRGGEHLAAYRDTEGALSLVSAVCPHMGCCVNWNTAAATWDCPCHGSRFTTAGEVIEGPALERLAPHPMPPLRSPAPAQPQPDVRH